MHYFEIENININNGISYIFNLSELDKLHQTNTPLKLFIEYDVIATYNLFTRWFHVCNRTLRSINLFDIYYFLNKDIHKVKLAYASSSDDVIYFISLQVKNITIKVINEDDQIIVDDFCFYL